MKNMYKILWIAIVWFFATRPIRAEYVLPYPSYMPGHMLYTISRGIDSVNIHWYWGNIAKLKYYLKLSDKYLVESKTLFEYKQFTLALDALHRSDQAFANLPLYVNRAQQEKKDISGFIQAISEAAVVHRRILGDLKTTLPETFIWATEKTEPSLLFLHDEINQSITVRAALVEL